MDCVDRMDCSSIESVIVTSRATEADRRHTTSTLLEAPAVRGTSGRITPGPVSSRLRAEAWTWCSSASLRSLRTTQVYLHQHCDGRRSQGSLGPAQLGQTQPQAGA